MEKKHGILCKASTCRYYDNQACTADSIQVGCSHCMSPNCTDDTACETFIPR